MPRARESSIASTSAQISRKRNSGKTGWSNSGITSRRKGPQRNGRRIDVALFLSEGDVVFIESVSNLFFAEYIREGQSIRLQHGGENQSKSPWEKFSSLIK